MTAPKTFRTEHDAPNWIAGKIKAGLGIVLPGIAQAASIAGGFNELTMRFAAIVAALLLIGYAGGPGCGKIPATSAFDRAVAEVGAGNLAAAKTLLEQSIAANPGSMGNALGYNLLGIVRWKLGEVEQAISAFESSRTLDETLPAPIYNLGVLMYRNGDAFRAATLLEGTARLDQSDARPLEYVAHIELEQENWSAAEEALLRALDRAPDSARIHTSLGVTRLHTQSPDAAAAEFRRALESDIRYAPASFNLALIHRSWLENEELAVHYIKQYLDTADELSRSGDALDLLNELSPASSADAVASAPSEGPAAPPPARAATSNRAPSSHWPPTIDELIRQAGIDSEAGRDTDAMLVCRKAAELAVEGGDPQIEEWVRARTITLCPRQAEAHYGLGMFLVRQQRHDEALTSLKRSVALAPQWVPAYLGMAEAATLAGESDAALVALQRTIRIEPTNRAGLLGLAYLYDRTMNRPVKAAEAYRRFLAAYPADPEADTAHARLVAMGESSPRDRDLSVAAELYNRGLRHQARGETDRAIQFFERAIELNEAFVDAHYSLGVAYQRSGDLEQCLGAYQTAIRMDPGHVKSRYNLALAHKAAGQNDAATEHLLAALESEPAHAKSHYLLGMVYADESVTREKAVTHYKSFLALAPDDPAAEPVRRWLSQTE